MENRLNAAVTNKYTYALIGILLFALLLRLPLLNYGLSANESHSLRVVQLLSEGDFANAVDSIFLNFHLPLDFALRFAFGIFSFSVESQRILSLLLALGSIILTYRLAKFIGGETAGLFSAALLSVMPLHIYLSAEARMYPLFVLLCIASVYRYMKYGVDGKIVLINLALVSSHLFSVFIVIGELLHYTFARKKYGNALLEKKGRMLLAPLALYAAYLSVVLFKYSGMRHDGLLEWIPKLTFARTLSIFNRILTGNLEMTWWNALIFLAVIVVLAISLKQYRKTSAMWCVLLASSSSILLSIVWRSILIEKYLVFLLPLIAVLLGVALSKSKSVIGWTLAGLFITAYAISSILTGSYALPPDSIDDMSGYLQSAMNQSHSSSYILVMPFDGYYYFPYYLDGTELIIPINAWPRDLEKNKLSNRSFTAEKMIFAAKKNPAKPDVQNEFLAYLDSNFEPVNRTEFAYYWLYEYRVPKRT